MRVQANDSLIIIVLQRSGKKEEKLKKTNDGLIIIDCCKHYPASSPALDFQGSHCELSMIFKYNFSPINNNKSMHNDKSM